MPPRSDFQHLLHMFLAVVLARWLIRLCYRGRVWHEAGSITGTAIFASNHRSFMDPIIVGAFRDRPLSYFARASLWKIPIIRQALDVLGGFPIDRNEPQLAVMKRTVTALKKGTSILMFPEGTRSKTGRLGTIRDGAALFSRRSGVPIVPVYLVRSESAWPRGSLLPVPGGHIGIVFGAPLVPPAGLRGRDQDVWVMQELTAWFARQEQRHLGAAA